MQTFDQALTRIEAAKLRWMTGGDGDPADCPIAGRSSGTEAQLRLLAQASQVRHTCLRPRLPEAHTHQPPFPEPVLPLLPDELRPVFRRLMSGAIAREDAQALTHLMASRGVMAHPFDWLPPADPTGFPEAYVPFAKWNAGFATEARTLSEDDWDDLYPAERRLAFATLRKTDPDGARTLLEEKGATLPADQRLGLVELLSNGLTDADQPYLQTLVDKDRSGKIKTQAAQLLARLGVTTDSESAAELADFLEVSTGGILRRTKTTGFRKKMNPVQRERAATLLQSVTLDGLASAMQMTSKDLIETWTTDTDPLIDGFLDLLLRTAAPQQIHRYWERLKTADGTSFLRLTPLAERLPQDILRSEMRSQIGRTKPAELPQLVALAGGDLDPESSVALLKSSLLGNIVKEIKDGIAARRNGKDWPKHAETMAAFALKNLGLLFQPDDAQKLLDRLTPDLFHIADPTLDALKFNAALKGADT